MVSKQPRPQLVTIVHIVMGSMPYEFTQVMSVWATKADAEAEEKRLTELAEAYEYKDDPTDAERDEIYQQTGNATNFWTNEFPVKRGSQ